MYFEVIRQCSESLRNLEACLDKAEGYAANKEIDIGVLLNARLAPDMQAFIYQVQSACDYVKAGAAWLSGQQPPRHPDTETTVGEVRARIRKTADFAEGVTDGQYAKAAEQKVRLSWAPGKVLPGKDYLLQMVVPNAYFHMAMAYAILRQGGVDVGKSDFLGAIRWAGAPA